MKQRNTSPLPEHNPNKEQVAQEMLAFCDELLYSTERPHSSEKASPSTQTTPYWEEDWMKELEEELATSIPSSSLSLATTPSDKEEQPVKTPTKIPTKKKQNQASKEYLEKKQSVESSQIFEDSVNIPPSELPPLDKQSDFPPSKQREEETKKPILKVKRKSTGSVYKRELSKEELEQAKNHRARQRQLFLKGGIDGWPEHHLLEFLLFYAIPRGDTKTLARELLASFGSLDHVLEASIEELCSVSGIQEKTASLIKFVPLLSSTYMKNRAVATTIVETTMDAYHLFLPYFMLTQVENVFFLFLTGKKEFISVKHYGKGTMVSSQFDVRTMVKEALIQQAVFVYVAHNHVNTSTVPTQEDWDVTSYLLSLFHPLHIFLLDHIIIGEKEGDMCSMKSLSYNKPLLWG